MQMDHGFLGCYVFSIDNYEWGAEYKRVLLGNLWNIGIPICGRAAL